MEHVKAGFFERYKPLIIILLVISSASFAVGAHPDFSAMHVFMGLFFVVFAMFKFFDIHGFVKGFKMYDLLAQRNRYYGYLYPFIELGLGLLYLSNAMPIMTDLITIVIMSVSAAGVIKALGSGMNVKCACLGTTLNVPLSTVAVLENVGMAIMAMYSIIFI